MGAVGPAAPGDRAIFNAFPSPLLPSTSHGFKPYCSIVQYVQYVHVHRFFIVSDTYASQRPVTKYYK
jgi:hypothetical protein